MTRLLSIRRIACTARTAAIPVAVAALAPVLTVALLLGCATEPVQPEPRADDQLFWRIALDHEAVLLSTTAPYDTLTLNVTPLNARGEPMPGAPAPQYHSRDIDRVVVVDGVLRAVAPGSEPVWVLASLTWGDLTYTDSVAVRVVDEPAPPVLAEFSIHPLLPDSAKVAQGWSWSLLPVRATDQAGAPVADIVASFRSSDENVALVDRITGAVQGAMPGVVTIHATATAFGVRKADTLLYRVGWPLSGRVGPASNPARRGALDLPPVATIGVGGFIMFTAGVSTTDIDFVFTEAAAVSLAPFNTTMLFDAALVDSYCSIFQADCTDDSGTFVVPRSQPDQPPVSAIRVFTTPGTYDYHSTALGDSGRIVVVDER